MTENPPVKEHGFAEQVHIGSFVFDAESDTLFDAFGSKVDLEAHPTEVLSVLARRFGQDVSEKTIVDEAWPEAPVTNDRVPVAVAKIREALQDADGKIVRTRPKKSYALIGEAAAPAKNRKRPYSIFMTLTGVAVLSAFALAYLA